MTNRQLAAEIWNKYIANPANNKGIDFSFEDLVKTLNGI